MTPVGIFKGATAAASRSSPSSRVGNCKWCGCRTVQPGQPQFIELGGNTRTLPADTLSTTALSATIFDAYKNKVADETAVSWVLDFDGALENGKTQTANGVVDVSYAVGDELGASSVTLQAGAVEQTFQIAKQTLNASLSASQTVLPAGTQGTTTLTFTTDAQDGTPVLWNTTRGEFISAADGVSGGQAVAVLRAAAVPGDGIVSASVAKRTEHIQITHAGGGTLTATFDQAAMVAGDLSGTVTVEGLAGPESYATPTTTAVTLQGTPGTPITLSAGGFYTPNGLPTLHYAMNGVDTNGMVYDQISQTPASVVGGGVEYDPQQSFTVPGASLLFNGGHLEIAPVAPLDAQEGLYANIRFRVSPDTPAGGGATLIRKRVLGTTTESWSLHVTGAQTLEARLTTDQGSFTAALPTTVVPGRWYIAGLRLRNGALELGLNGERAVTPFTGTLVGAGGGIEVGTGFSGHLDDVKLGIESSANALFTFADGSLSQNLVIGADGTARVGIQATTNDPGEQGQIIGLTAYEQTQTTAGVALRERELRMGGLSEFLGIRSAYAYANGSAAAQEAGVAVVRPVKWGAIAQWVGKKVFGPYFDEVKVAAEFVYQLTAVSDVVTLMKAVVSFAQDGDARNVDGFEVTFATVSIGITVLTLSSGEGAAALPEVRSGLVAIKPVLKELFSTGLPEALQTGKLLGKYIFKQMMNVVTNPRAVVAEAGELATALKATVLGGARSVEYLFRTVRSLSDLKRWLRLRKLAGTCLADRAEGPLRYAAIGPEGQFWLLDELASSVGEALFGRSAYAASAQCISVLAKLDEIELTYGATVHNAVADAVDVLHAYKDANGRNVLAIFGADSFDVLASVALKDPGVVKKFAENATNQFRTGANFRLAARGEALDTMLGYIKKIDPATLGYDTWVKKLGSNMFMIKAIAGEAQGIEAVMQAYKGRGVRLEHLSDRVDVPYEKLDGEDIVIATRNKEGVDGVFRLDDGTPVFMEAKAVSGNTKLTEQQIYDRIVEQYEKHLTTKVLPYVKDDRVGGFVFDVDGAEVAPIMHYHLVGDWFTPARVAEIHKRLDGVVADKFPEIMSANPAFSKNVTVGATIQTIIN